jgi:flavodoxin
MKTLVVFYSRDGHTRKIAHEIAIALHADIEELHEKTSRKGILGWLRAGCDGWRKKEATLLPLHFTPSKYDLVIIGTPIWGFTMVPAIRSWVTQVGSQAKQVAFFATMGGSGDKKAFQEMQQLCGKTPTHTITFIDKQIDKNNHSPLLKFFIEKLKK